jgi:putative transposase
VFTDRMLISCEHTMRAVCADLDAELVELNSETDHAHLRRLPANPGDLDTGIAAHRPHRPTPCAANTATPWSPSHVAVSYGGADLSTIKQCIDGQSRPL